MPGFWKREIRREEKERQVEKRKSEKEKKEKEKKMVGGTSHNDRQKDAG